MIIDDFQAWLQSHYPSIPVLIKPFRGTDADGIVMNGPAPEGDYMTVFDIDSVGSCYPIVEKTRDDDTIIFDAQNHVEHKIEVNAYASNGAEILHGIENLASLPPVRLDDVPEEDDVTFRPIFIESSRVRNLAFLNDTHHAYRYQCEFTIQTSYMKQRVEPRVSRVRVEGTFAGMDAVSDTDLQET